MTSTNQYKLISDVIRCVKPVHPSEIEIILKHAEEHACQIGDRGADFSAMSAIEKVDYLLPKSNYQ